MFFSFLLILTSPRIYLQRLPSISCQLVRFVSLVVAVMAGRYRLYAWGGTMGSG
jgi:hypothetical protein